MFLDVSQLWVYCTSVVLTPSVTLPYIWQLSLHIVMSSTWTDAMYSDLACRYHSIAFWLWVLLSWNRMADLFLLSFTSYWDIASDILINLSFENPVISLGWILVLTILSLFSCSHLAFQYVDSTLYFRNGLRTLIFIWWCMIFLICFCIQFASILLRTFASMFIKKISL
jgi:hypothetical protein